MLTTEQRIGAFFVIALLLFGVAIELTIGTGLLRRRWVVYADFADVQGLDAGADVRLAGIKAGRVDGMEIAADRVRVALAIDAGLEIRRDAIAKLDFRALSGERYVALSLGTPTAPLAQPGDVLLGETPASFADAVDQLADVASSITDLTARLRDDAGRLLVGLGDLVEENRTSLTALSENLASITEKLDRGTGTLGQLVNDPALYDRVASAVGDIQTSATDLGTLARNLRDGEGTLGKLMTEDDGLYAQLRDTVDTMQTAAANVQEITGKLKDGEGSLGRALVDDTLYAESIDTLRTANRAAQSLEDQAPISLLGTIVTSLF